MTHFVLGQDIFDLAALLLILGLAIAGFRLCLRIERLDEALYGPRSPAEGLAAPIHAEGAPESAERNTGASP